MMGWMAAKKISNRIQEIQLVVEKEVAEPLREWLGRVKASNTALPGIVFENRRNRALQRVSEALVSRGSTSIPDELKSEAESLLRQWAQRDFDDGFDLVQEFEIRAARDRDLAIALESGDQSGVLRAKESEYRARILERYGRVELRGLQTSHRVLLDLDEVYVPLHLEEKLRLEAETKKGDGGPLGYLLPARVPLLEALREKRQILVVGPPGSGKSTLVAYLATLAAAGRLSCELEIESEILPVLLIARELVDEDLSSQSIARQMGCDAEMLKQALEQGRVLLLLDGLDEVPTSTQNLLAIQVEELTRRQPEALVVLTSRPTGAPGEVERALPFLHPFQLAELTQEEVGQFVDRWCLAAETSVRTDHAAARREAEKAAMDLKRRIASSRSVQRTAVNPLLASVLCVVHRFHGQKIPERRVALYEKCTDALLYEWDRSKFPEGAVVGLLDAAAKRRLLMGVARRLHEDHKAEVSAEAVVAIFADTLPDLGIDAEDAERLTAEIRDRTGVLVERRPGWFAFSHLSFQEYLTALDYARTGETRKLADRFEDAWWQEVILLSTGVPGGLAGKVVEGLLSKKERLATTLAARCLETAVELPLSARKKVETALKEMIPPKDIHQSVELAQVGAVVAPLLAQALPNEFPNRQLDSKTMFTIVALSLIDYEPAIPLLLRAIGFREALFVVDDFALSLGEFVTWQFFIRAPNSKAALLALKRGLDANRDVRFLRLLSRTFPKHADQAELLDAALKEAQGEKPSSKRAQNTA